MLYHTVYQSTVIPKRSGSWDQIRMRNAFENENIKQQHAIYDIVNDF
jgi:hypothetical protein